MSEQSWRPLTLRRDDTCSQCGGRLTAGERAEWHRADGAVRCQTCPSTAASASGHDRPPPSDTPEDWKHLRLRRPAVCSCCRAVLPAGTVAQWSRAQWATRCAGHGPAAPPADAASRTLGSPPRVSGTAGASAQAEYERRKARRERKVRDAHPILGGVILALSDEPQHVRAWAQGAAGERAVARRLDTLTEHGIEVLHDRRIPRTKANIDHIAVSTSGVYVIDAKNYTGKVQVDWQGGLFSPRTYTLRVGRRDATKLVSGVQHQVELVRAALSSPGAAGLELVPVTGVLAFFDADWPLFPPDEIDGVRLEGPKSTTKVIRRPGHLPQTTITAVAELLRSAFPEAR